ncbi:M23 family metallopeptidase [Streptomyces sp. NPDC015131]|uniref:M23 family metallopeptidase n=1 Tax=Streptomyces sp. NPDC015131 TaxID=3364941 RepID=UPI0036F6D893
MVLVALAALLALLPHPAPAAAADAGGRGGAAAEVARLYDEAARATEAYEQGRRAAAVQRTLAGRLQRALAVKRRELAGLNDRMGEVARAQYRSGGSAGLAARLLLGDDADEVIRAEQVARQADRVVNRLMRRTREAEGRLARAEGEARAAWRDLDARSRRLAAIRKGVETRLERAQWRLQAEADQKAASGRCGGAAPAGPAPGTGSGSGAGAASGPALGTASGPGAGSGSGSGAGSGSGPRAGGGGRWVAPVEGYALSAGFARAGAHWAHRHTGQDFAVPVGTPVRSIGAGRVESVSCGGGFGIQVVVRHAGGWYSQYAHLAAPAVTPGRPVAAGQPIGRSGNTGNSTGPHLHFEVRLTPYMGSAVDPVRWLAEHGVRLGPTP